MIDKSWKLQRYDRKDYTELVEFPVEIVGRDGVVRRYSFEDAIRLYQRRITFSAVRYRDDELTRAENGHCRARIEQLRRSYFRRFGWPALSGTPAGDQSFGELAGEITSFLRRALHVQGSLDVRVEAVEATADGDGTWYVRPLGDGGWAAFLYVARISESERRDQFLRQLREFEAARPEGVDTERLIASHQVLDCGLILTGDAEAVARIAALDTGVEEAVDVDPTPWDEAVDAARRGEHVLALRRCRDIVAAQPWHRQAYTAGAILGCMTGDALAAEELALLGTKYFPEDAPLRYWLAVARQRQGDEAAVEAAAEAVRLAPDHAPARLLLASAHVRAGELQAARALLQDLSAQSSDRELRWLSSTLGWRRRLAVGGALAALAAPAVAWWAGLAALVPAVLAFAALIGWARLTRAVELRAARPRSDDLGHALRQVLRRNTGTIVS